MKTSKKYLDMIGHATITNGSPNLISRDLKNLNKSIGSGKESRSTTSESIHDYLTGNTDLDEFQTDYRYEVDKTFESPYFYDSQELINETFHLLESDPVIPEARLLEGFKAGLIDTINNAFLKTERGWIDDEMNTVLPPNASLEQVKSIVSSKARIIPSLSISDLENAEQQGELFINKRLVAYKIEAEEVIESMKGLPGGKELKWVDASSNKTFNEGELIRLIHHRSDPIAILAGTPARTMYHASVTDSKAPEDSHVIRTGVSRQGDAVYSTSSINEAVKVYGNPRSFEIRGKLLQEHEKNGIDRDKHIFGHLYKIQSNASLYKANMEKKHLTFEDVPSPSSITLLARENGSSEGFAMNWWMMMKSAGSTYDMYCALNEFSERLYKDNTDKHGSNVMNKVLSSMGFQGLEIEFPEPEKFTEYNEKIDNIKSLDQSELSMGKNSIVQAMEHYVNRLKENIPAKAESSHVLIFDTKNMKKEYLGILPLNKEVLNKKDFFYSRDEEITLEDLNLSNKQKSLDEYSM